METPAARWTLTELTVEERLSDNDTDRKCASEANESNLSPFDDLLQNNSMSVHVKPGRRCTAFAGHHFFSSTCWPLRSGRWFSNNQCISLSLYRRSRGSVRFTWPATSNARPFRNNYKAHQDRMLRGLEEWRCVKVQKSHRRQTQSRVERRANCASRKVEPSIVR